MDMSALAELRKARQQTGQLTEERQKQTEKIFLVGCELLKRCQDNHFQDSRMISGAYDCFSFVIENNRTDPRAYVQIGYLFLCYNNLLKATEYLKEAQRIDPQNTDVKKLLAYAQTKATQDIKNPGKEAPSATQAIKIQPLIDSNQEIDYDALYDRVEMLLHDQLRIAFQHMNQLRPSPEAFALDTIRQVATVLQHNYDQLGEALDVLAEEFELADLEMKYKQLGVSVNGLQDTLTLSESFAQLKTNMLDLYNQVMDAMASQGATQTLLDEALNQVDILADELDKLEGTGYNIDPVSKYYNKLLQSIEKLQKLVDEI